MKKLIIIALLLTVFGGASQFEHNYTRENCKVISVNNGKAKIRDRCGFVWGYESDNLKYGDIVNLKVNDNRTSENIEDDIITKVVKR